MRRHQYIYNRWDTWKDCQREDWTCVDMYQSFGGGEVGTSIEKEDMGLVQSDQLCDVDLH